MKKILILSFFILPYHFLFGVPRFHVEKNQYDFGRFPANQTVSAVYEVQNSGNSTLNISAVRSTCSCAKIEFPRQIPPGTKKKLLLKIDGNSFSAQVSGKLYVISDSPGSPDELIFSGYAVPLYVLSPAAEQYLATVKAGSLIKKVFTVRTSEKISFGKAKIPRNCTARIELSNVTGNEQKITVELDRITGKPGTRFSFEIDIPILKPVGWPPLKLHFYGHIK